MKTKIRNIFKLTGIMLSAISVLSIPLLTVISCSRIHEGPPPWVPEDYTNWTWEKHVKGEYSVYPPWVLRYTSKDFKAKGWYDKTQILLSDWERDFPDIEVIGGGSFEGGLCPNLEYIEIPNTVRIIGGDAFASASYYENHLKRGVKMSNSVLEYGPSCFMDAKTQIAISTSIMRIDEKAFKRARVPVYTPQTGERLPYLNFPASIWWIDDYAFEDLQFDASDKNMQLMFTQDRNLEHIGVGAFSVEKKSGFTDLFMVPRNLKEFNFQSLVGTSITDIWFDPNAVNTKLVFPANKSIKDLYYALKTVTMPKAFERTVHDNPNFFINDGTITYSFEAPTEPTE